MTAHARNLLLGKNEHDSLPINNPLSQQHELSEKQFETNADGKNLERLAIEASGHIFYNWDCQTYRVIWGGNLEQIFGYSDTEIVNSLDWWQQLIHPDDLPVFIGEMQNGITNETCLSIEYRVKAKDGNYINVIQKGCFHVGENGKLTQIIGIITDITLRKKAEEKLRHRLVLETAIARVSKELALDNQGGLERSLEMLGIAARASRAYLMRFSPQATRGSMIHQWCESTIDGYIGNFQDVDLSIFPWWVEQLRQHKYILIPDVKALPETAEAERKYLNAIGINSVIAIPIYDSHGQLWGQIGLDSTGEKHKTWSEEDGQLLSVVAEMIYRYHERISEQEKTRKSEALYSGIFNHSADPIFLIKVLPDGEFVYKTVNPAYEQSSGISLDEIIGKTPREIFPVETAIQLERWYRTCVKLRETIYYEEALELPLGQRIWRTNLVPIVDHQGKVTTLQGNSRDITEERKAINEQMRYARHQRLLASLTLKIRQSLEIEEILQTAVEQIHNTLKVDRVLFIKMLPDGTAKVVNEFVVTGFASLLNEIFEDNCFFQEYQKQHFWGQVKECADVTALVFDDCDKAFLERAQIRSYVVLPILITRRNEQTNPLLWGFLSVQQCSGKRQWSNEEIELLRQLTNQLSIALNQSELREQEIKQREELARSNEDLEKFAYIISHDLQEPLGIITSYGQLLQRRYQGQLDAKADKYIRHIVQTTRRMRQQIDDLLAYSRLGTRKQPFQPVDCKWVLEQVLANLEVSILKNQATIDIQTPLPTVIADPSQLIQLLQNLISNGIKYHSQAPPIIEISVRRQGDNWLFSIRDNGIGLDPKYSQRIFEIFQRLHTQQEYPGSGIGLAICQRIVQRHGGRIWVESQPGKGSTFYFTIPLRQ